MYNGILLDLDDTLYDYDTAHSVAMGAVIDLLSKKFSLNSEQIEKKYKIARKNIHIELSNKASSHNRLLYFQRMLELLNINSLRYTLEVYETYWNNFLDNLHIYEDVYSWLEIVKHKKICLVTDLTAKIQFRKIERLKLDDYIDFIVTSEEAGIEKPHPYVFMLALHKIGLRPAEVCMVGDSYKKDIIGASNLGITSYWFNVKNETNEINELITVFKSYKELVRYFE